MVAAIQTVVFPVAGLGTRFLPATKASPKEMLPVVDKPLIQYAVEEAVAAGADHLIFVTGRTGNSIEDHFDTAFELERELAARGRHALLDVVRNTAPRGVSCSYVRQGAPRGLGHAVLSVRPFLGEQPFAVVLADDLIRTGLRSALGQMTELFEWDRRSLLAVEPVPENELHNYGVVRLMDRQPADSRLLGLDGIVEKPRPGRAPSNLAVVGRYIFTPAIFRHLEALRPDVNGIIHLTEAIAGLIREEAVFAYRFDGARYDCGTVLGYLKATLDYGLGHPDLATDLRAHLAQP